MSCFQVSNRHAATIVTAAQAYSRGARFSWYANGERYELDNAASEPWTETRAPFAGCTPYTVTNYTPDAMGAAMLYENSRSVAYRYDDEEPYAYQYRHHTEPASAVQVIKACDCWRYQTCEHPEHAATVAWAFVDAVREAAIDHLPGYDEAAWSIDEYTHTTERIA